MNYFELFEMPVQLRPDKEAVKRKYFELSRKYHPDHFTQTGASEQLESLETSAMLNKGLKVLSNQDETIKYVLQLKGLLEEEEKYNLPPEFLMQMMEINEEAAELSFDADPDKRIRLYQQITELENELYEPVKNIIEGYEEGVTTKEELLQVKDYYFKKKYLLRLAQQMKGKP